MPTIRIVSIDSSYAEFAGEGMALAVLSFSKLADLLSSPIDLEPSYYDGFAQVGGRHRGESAAEYLAAHGCAADAGLMCVEMPVPKQIAAKMRLRVPKGALADTEAVALFHAGRAGSIAPLHYDWDHRWVMHACLSGRKTIYLIPPEAGWLLSPVINTSAICMPRLSEADRVDLLRRLGGTEVTLEGGQAVLFPSLWWHAVLYHAPSMSVSVRFDERPELRPFSVLPRSFWLQRLVWLLFRCDARVAREPLLNGILDAFFSRRGTWLDRYKRVNDIYRQALRAAGEHGGAEYLTSDSFNAELALARLELKELYSLGRPSHPAGIDEETIEATGRYLFGDEAAGATQRALAQYALAKRQGLPPRRGLIAVHHT